jgi:hypothetical protein
VNRSLRRSWQPFPVNNDYFPLIVKLAESFLRSTIVELVTVTLP